MVNGHESMNMSIDGLHAGMDLGLEIWGGVDQRMVNATISCNFFPLVVFDFSEALLLK